MARLSVNSLLVILIAQLSLLLQLTTNIGAYVLFKIDKRVKQYFISEKSEVTGFRDPSELGRPDLVSVTLNLPQLSDSTEKRSRLLLHIRRERLRLKNSTTQKVNADDERQSTSINHEESNSESILLSHGNVTVEFSNPASDLLTSLVSTCSSLPQSAPPTIDPCRVPREWLRVQDAGLRGRGLFALHAIEKNSLLGEYVGEVLSQKQYSARYPKGDSEYTFLISEEAQRRDRIYVDAADESKSNIFRFDKFFLHSITLSYLSLYVQLSKSIECKNIPYCAVVLCNMFLSS